MSEKLPLPARKKPMPHLVKPMLATLIDGPFDDPDWIYEIKWDGFRAVAETGSRRTALYSRNLNNFAPMFPWVFDELRQIRMPLILDGEIVAFDEEGRPRFQLLKGNVVPHERILYYVFDLLYIDGYDVTALPLLERKRLLKEALPEYLDRVRYCDHLFERGTEFFQRIAEQDMEGIIAKDARSPYVIGKRTRHWLKIKTEQQVEAVIAGFTEPKGSRQHLGSLMLAMPENNRLRYIGNVGSGFDTKGLARMRQQLSSLEIPRPPVHNPPRIGDAKVAHWVRPELVCRVRFQEWTNDGRLRHPVFLGLSTTDPASLRMPLLG